VSEAYGLWFIVCPLFIVHAYIALTVFS